MKRAVVKIILKLQAYKFNQQILRNQHAKQHIEDFSVNIKDNDSDFSYCGESYYQEEDDSNNSLDTLSAVSEESDSSVEKIKLNVNVENTEISEDVLGKDEKEIRTFDAGTPLKKTRTKMHALSHQELGDASLTSQMQQSKDLPEMINQDSRESLPN